MRREFCIGVVLAIAVAPVVWAQAQSERLVAPVLPGFVLGYSAANTAQSIREEVPKGESVQNWTRMVTTQKFTGLATRATPAQYAQNTLAGLPRACPGAVVTPVTSLKLGGRSAARFEVNCPKGTGGKPESFILLAVAGKTDMHVKQVAFRGRIAPADLAWGRKYLNGVMLCVSGSTLPACR